MLPLQSKTTPTESGASSLENWVISCGSLSSNSLKFSFSSPVTKRFKGSVTVTGISTSVLSTRMFDRGRGSSLLTRFGPNLEIRLSPDGRSQTNPHGATNQQLSAGRQHSGWPAFLSQE